MKQQTNLFTTKVFITVLLAAYALDIRPIQDDLITNGWQRAYYSNIVDFLINVVTVLVARGSSNEEGKVYTPKGMPGSDREKD